MAGTAVAEFAKDRARVGPLEGATHIGTIGEPGEGAYVRIWLTVWDGKIAEASYMTHPCPSCALAGAMVITLITGRTAEQAVLVTGEDVERVLGGLPPGRGHFAQMAVSALRRALEETK